MPSWHSGLGQVGDKEHSTNRQSDHPLSGITVDYGADYGAITVTDYGDRDYGDSLLNALNCLCIDHGPSMLPKSSPHGVGEGLEGVLEGGALFEGDQHRDRGAGAQREVAAAHLFERLHPVVRNADFGGVV